MADMERDAGRRRKRIRISPALTSAFVLSVLTAVFFLQGRAYRSGWLGFFGNVTTGQFPYLQLRT